MEKAFDKKVLVAKLQAASLPIAEEAVEVLVKEVFDWAKESAAIHPNAIVKSAVPLAISVLEPVVKTALDKIDGQEG